MIGVTMRLENEVAWKRGVAAISKPGTYEPEIKKGLNALGKATRDRMRKKPPVYRKKLHDAIESRYEKAGAGSFGSEHIGPDEGKARLDYAGVAEEGRQPNKPFPNVRAITEWLQFRKLGKGQTPARAAFLIGRAIAKGGTPSERNPRWKKVPTYVEPTFKEVQSALDASGLADAVLVTMHKELPG